MLKWFNIINNNKIIMKYKFNKQIINNKKNNRKLIDLDLKISNRY